MKSSTTQPSRQRAARVRAEVAGGEVLAVEPVDGQAPPVALDADDVALTERRERVAAVHVARASTPATPP